MVIVTVKGGELDGAAGSLQSVNITRGVAMVRVSGCVNNRPVKGTFELPLFMVDGVPSELARGYSAFRGAK